MNDPRVAPYGTWKSPITAELLVAVSGWARGVPIVLDGDDVYWIEPRPAEGGRCVVMRYALDGQLTCLTEAGFSVRTRVHEYGGGALAVHGGTLYFSNDADQRLYRKDPGSAPRPLTPPSDGGSRRHADLAIDARRGRLVCVREEHVAGVPEPVNTLVSVPLSGDSAGEVIVSGADFYSSPTWSPDGSRLAWLSWSHPNMPWDGCELWVAEVGEDGALGRRELVAGGAEESIYNPQWSPFGVLYFVSDRTGFWNLYRLSGGAVTAICPMEAEFGVPQWVFGMSSYGFLSADRIFASFAIDGRFHLGVIDTSSGILARLETTYTEVNFVRAANGRAVFCGGGPTETTVIAGYDAARRRFLVLYGPPAPAIDEADLSIPEAISYPTEGGLTAHAFYYAPHNRAYAAPPDEKPPLIVISHGGPTGATSTVLHPAIQFWTSRGFAVLDVNYGGSSGYGRAYRLRLDGAWGVVDVDDCVNGARHLVQRGLVDGARLIIRGGSAGGYTTLAALTFRDVFKAGASYYGIGELSSGMEATHKFESRYADRLIGPWPSRADLYRERSPLNFTERLSCPIIFFQGMEDKAVPPAQAEKMVAALRARKLPVAYLPFEGEQHGFRRAENIKRSILAELYFYSRVFGFELAEPVEPVTIENL